MTAFRALALFVFGILAGGLGACDPPTDLGKLCALRTADGGAYLTVSATDDFYDQGTADCQNLVCLRPAGSPLDAGIGFCSSPCTPKNARDLNSPSDDCAGASAPLVCRQAALSPSLIQYILKNGGEKLLEEFQGGVTAQQLCTTPLGG